MRSLPLLSKRLALVCLLFCLMLATPALADIYGKIAGRVVDATSGEPLIGVNVFVEGTTLGASTDLEGYYTILRVRPGTYTVRAAYIGYAATSVENVQVQVDKTSTVNFDLREEVIEGEEIVITAERGVVQVDRTTTTAVVSGEQLETLPVTSINDAINLQAGVVDGRFRGGRAGEVAYLVNGVPINNAYNSSAAFEVEQNMVSSLQVISGVFNAEYGQALSGVVNIVTKDLPREWSGSFLGYAGTIASGRELEFVNRTAAAGAGLTPADFESEMVSFNDALDVNNLNDVQVSFGGPILKDKLGIQLSGRYFSDDGYLVGRNLFAPSDSSANLTSGNPENFFIESTGDGSFVPLRPTDRLSLNGSLNYNISKNLKLEYNLFLQDGEGLACGDCHDRKYVPDGINRDFQNNQTHIVGLRYTLGTKSFGKISYSYLRDTYDQYLYESPNDSRYQSNRLDNLNGANAFEVAGNTLFTLDEETTTHTVIADFSSQINRVHLMKTGVQARFHRLDNRSFSIERSARTGFRPQPSPDIFSDNSLNASPVEFAAYVQDKMEFTGLIVNAGLRFDYFDPDYDIPVDWRQAQAERVLDVATGDSVSNRVAADPSFQLSPRLGIAFPISEQGVMRFSAGLFFQTPTLFRLYTNPEYEVNPLSLSTQYGNPAMEPERTLAFELGLQQGLTRDIGLELTLFSKDVRNLTGQEIVRNPNGDFAVRWINRDYGTIRGLTFSLFRQPTAPISWTLDYTLQFAQGTSSDPGEAFGRQQSGLEPILSLVRLNWDRRHVLNNTITIAPRDGLTFTMINQLRSGEPYTTVREFVRSTIPNNADRPLQFFSDLRLFYAVPFFSRNVELLAQVQNLFDNEVVFAVWQSTGEPDSSVEEQLARRQGSVGGVNSIDEFFLRQAWFGAPRRISLGLRVAL
ncbi:MAG: TonB-dependent receptor [Bacteroidota bacterium]